MVRTRVFSIDDDHVMVIFRYSETLGRYLGDYPDFTVERRYTPDGRPWVNVTIEGCPYAPQPYNDCGSCKHLKKQEQMDLIGVCFREEHRRREDAHG